MNALVTGAAGFVGSKLVARLAGQGISVRATVRRGLICPGSGTTLVERVKADVTDPESLTAVTRGCNVIYHCAWGGSSLEEQWRVNVQGTRNVVEAGARAGVRRLVHISSIAVHGQRLPSVLTEDYPLVSEGDPYSVSKAEGERVAFEIGARMGLEVVALRPTLVYGTHAPLWILAYFERVRLERVALISGGYGLANLVHVDDLIDGMLAASTAEHVGGEAFLINGPDSITWREYLGYFAHMCGKPLPRSIPAWLARVLLPSTKIWSLLAGRAPRVTQMDVQLMTGHCIVSTAKASLMLGYRPRVPIEQGMAECEQWLRGEGHLRSKGHRNLRPEVPKSPRTVTHSAEATA